MFKLIRKVFKKIEATLMICKIKKLFLKADAL